jgi:hypothetical protein
MITAKDIRKAEQHIIDEWGSEIGGKVVNEACFVRHTEPFNGGTKEFLDHCVCCGGNWCGMFLSGIEKLYPAVYAAIPDDMGATGNEAFLNITYVMMLCGVDTSR